MVKVNARSRDGEEQVVEASAGAALMEPLRDAGLVEAVCGGVASCGTCHIYVGAEWADKLNARTEDETYMLESLESVAEVRTESRLSCQITLTEEMDGLSVEVAQDF